MLKSWQQKWSYGTKISEDNFYWNAFYSTWKASDELFWCGYDLEKSTRAYRRPKKHFYGDVKFCSSQDVVFSIHLAQRTLRNSVLFSFSLICFWYEHFSHNKHTFFGLTKMCSLWVGIVPILNERMKFTTTRNLQKQRLQNEHR